MFVKYTFVTFLNLNILCFQAEKSKSEGTVHFYPLCSLIPVTNECMSFVLMVLPGHIAVLCGTDLHTEGSGDSFLAHHPSVHFSKTQIKGVIGHLSPLQYILLSS